MKTAQIIQRKDLNGIIVRQNHKTGFFNGNDLLDIYNQTSEVKAEMSEYLRSKQFKDFRITVLKDILQNMQNLHISNGASTRPSGHLTTNEAIVLSKRGKNGGVWMHPYIFMDFAMWLSSDFKLTCIKWLYDKLIQVRDEAGDSFKEVNTALFSVKPQCTPRDYANEATMINKLVFGTTDSGQRNQATVEQLELLKSLQYADISLIQSKIDFYERYEQLKKFKTLYFLMNPKNAK